MNDDRDASRARAATQRIIERIGSIGPEDLESAVERIITRLDAYKGAGVGWPDATPMSLDRLADIKFALVYAGADAAPKMSGAVHKMLRDCMDEMARLRNLVAEWKASQARAVDAELAARASLVQMAQKVAVARRDAMLEAADWLNEKHPEAAAALTGLGNSCATCRVWPCVCEL